MTRYWTELARRLTPYVPGEQRSGANIVKLNTNENPYPPSPSVRYWNTDRLSRWLRISIGTNDEMTQLFAVLDRYAT